MLREALIELLRGGHGDPPYLASVALLGVALLLFVKTALSWRTGRRTEGDPALPRVGALLLVALGPLLIWASCVVSYRATLPVVRRIIWPPIQAIVDVPDWVEFDSPVWPLEDLLSGLSTTGLFVATAGFLLARGRRLGLWDGYLVANPVTIVAGCLLCAFASGMSREFEHWGATTWALRVIAASPIFAWLFYLGGKWRHDRAAA